MCVLVVYNRARITLILQILLINNIWDWNSDKILLINVNYIQALNLIFGVYSCIYLKLEISI